MKRLLACCILSVFLTFGGCATIGTQPTTPTSTNQTITDTLTTIGTVLAKVPATSEALLNSGVITKDQYNKIATVYLQAKTAFITAADAQELNLLMGTADSQTKYDIAFQNLTKINTDLQQLLISFGGK